MRVRCRRTFVRPSSTSFRDVIRGAARRPTSTLLDEEMTGNDLSPFEQALGAETIARYDAALAALRPQEREAIIGRVELGNDYAELAGSARQAAATAPRRLAVHRAMLRLAGGDAAWPRITTSSRRLRPPSPTGCL